MRRLRSFLRGFRIALRLSGLVLIAVSYLLPDHVIAVLAIAISLLSSRVQRYLRLF